MATVTATMSAMDWLHSRRHLATQQAQPRKMSSATRRRSSVALHPAPFISANTTGKKPTLLTLPAELRLEIYTMLFQDEIQRIKPEYTLPGILTTCRQTYTEAITSYYSTSIFRCLEEDSTVSWLVNLPEEFRNLITEVRYDTRWIIFIRPYIPVPGAESWLFQNLVAKLKERGFDLYQWIGEREGRVKVSWYQGGKGGGIRWTDKPGLIEVVQSSG